MPDRGFSARLVSCFIGLALLGLAWFFFLRGFGWPLTAVIAGTILLATLLPPRIANIAGGLGMLGVAALLYFYHNAGMMATFIAVLGTIDLVTGIIRFTRPADLSQH